MFEWLFGKSFEPERDIPSLEGKVILVTGGNVGLGKEMITQLAKHNPREIFLAARTPSKGEAAIEDIKKTVPNANISYLKLDLSSFASVKSAVDDFHRRSDRLDILVNNAGIMAMPYSQTEDGYEIQFGTCHMGHFLLTKLLLPTLLRTAEEPNSDVRVINLSSIGHNMAPYPNLIYDQAELEKWNTWRRYGQAKIANMWHARELQKRHPSLTATSVHPGFIMTNLYSASASNFVMKAGYKVMGTVFSDVPTGAKNQLWAATAPKDVVKKSYYWTPVASKSGGSPWLAGNEKKAAQLFDWSERELERKGY